MDGVNFLTAENRKKMEDLFRDCPQDVKDAVVLEKIPKKTYFIKAGGAASFIYILLSGRVEGIDFVGYGRVFSFREFDEGTVLGDYECLAGINNYTVSLQAIEDCWFWVMPADAYLSWLNRDPHALMIRTHDLIECVVQRSQVGIHLALEIAGKKAQLFSCLDRRSRHDDPADLVGLKCRDGHGHAELSL